jgi:hypothetical protein
MNEHSTHDTYLFTLDFYRTMQILKPKCGLGLCWNRNVKTSVFEIEVQRREVSVRMSESSSSSSSSSNSRTEYYKPVVMFRSFKTVLFCYLSMLSPSSLLHTLASCSYDVSNVTYISVTWYIISNHSAPENGYEWC